MQEKKKKNKKKRKTEDEEEEHSRTQLVNIAGPYFHTKEKEIIIRVITIIIRSRIVIRIG